MTSLQPGTQYHVCLVAKNKIGSTIGSENSFTTKSTAPTIESVTAKTVPGEVTLEGRVNPNAQEAMCEFLYGTTGSYGSTVPCAEQLGNNGERTSAHAHLTNLAPNTTYYFQMVVHNEVGQSAPSEGKGTFTTQPVSTPGGPSGGGTGTIPGAIEPLPVNAQIEKEFWEHPPWDRAPTSVTETTATTAKTTHLTRAQKLTKALKACKHERSVRKRANCVKRARRKYRASKTPRASRGM